MPRVRPRLVRTLPHDPEAFTQGLAYHDRRLYESTGLLGKSSLRELDPHDGTLVKTVPVPGDFAEGVAVMDGRLYQLTWKSGRAIVYDVVDLSPIGEVSYRGEGWGLAAAPRHLIMSDGSSVLRFRDAELRVLRRLRATSRGIPLRHLNDVECASGKIYANVLDSSTIVELSESSGRLTRIIDCSELVALDGPHRREHVLNGVAFKRESGTFLITGKCWRHLFEVELPT